MLHGDFMVACAFDYIANLNKLSCMLSLANDNAGSTTNADILKELLTWFLLLCLYFRTLDPPTIGVWIWGTMFTLFAFTKKILASFTFFSIININIQQ